MSEQSPTTSKPSGWRFAPLAIFAILFLWFFFRAIFFPNILVYRDAGFFFQRLFRFIQEEWYAGRVPLWNPYDNCGAPLLANATSSVFYPGKLIFLLPMPFEWSYNWYVLGHILLAGGLAYRVSRSWGTSGYGATICALSYAFCGNVVYQYANLIFLVGAAWLPAALWSTERMLRERSLIAAIGLGVVLALMVLGGDAQMAYNAGLLAVLYAFLTRRKKKTVMEAATAGEPVAETAEEVSLQEDSADDVESTVAEEQHTEAVWRRPIYLLAIAAFCGLILSAVQVLPTTEWSAQSSRGRYIFPRTIYEIPNYSSKNLPEGDILSEPKWYDGLLAKPPMHIGAETTYDYSVAPWRLTEVIWPWISGCSHSTQRRWIYKFAPEADWTPSLYMAILPLLLAVFSWKVRKADPRIRWLSWIVLFTLIAGLGKYGVGWLLRVCTSNGAVGEFAVGDPFGGCYWLMNVVLPGYIQFRWPGKLLVVTAIGASLLAGFGWDHVTKHGSKNVRLALAVIAALSLLGCAFMFIRWQGCVDWFNEMPAGSVRGPFDATGACWDIFLSFTHVAAICALLWALLFQIEKQSSRLLQIAVLAVVAIDLGIANGWMIETHPTARFRALGGLAEHIEQAEGQHGDVRGGVTQPFRVHCLPYIKPTHWIHDSSANRNAEVREWSRNVLLPKNNTPTRIELAQADGDTFQSYDHQLMLGSAPWFGPNNQVMAIMQPRRTLDAMNAKYFILPPAGGAADLKTFGLRQAWADIPWSPYNPQPVPAGPPLQPAVNQPIDDVVLLYNENYLPRAWIVHDIVSISPIKRLELAKLTQVSQSISFPFEKELHLRRTAIVESDEVPSTQFQAATDPQSESCSVINYESQRVELQVQLQNPGLVVLSDLFEKNWIVEETTDAGVTTHQMLRTNRIMRGVMLQPGEHHLVFRYVPTQFYVGAVISAIGWIVILALGMYWFRRDGKSKCDST